MDKNNIKKLLDQYFEGETRLEEEQLLKTYFTSSDIDPELERFKHLFAFFAQEKQLKIHTDFQVYSIKKPAKIIPLKVRKWAVAAVLVLSISSWYFKNESIDNKQASQQIDWSKYEPKTEQQAMKVTFEAFKKTSSAIRKGTRVVGNEVKELKRLAEFEF